MKVGEAVGKLASILRLQAALAKQTAHANSSRQQGSRLGTT